MQKNMNDEPRTPDKIKLTTRGKKVAAMALVGATLAAGGAVDKIISSDKASAQPAQEQPKDRIHNVKPGDTLEEIAKADLENRANDQAFALEPTESEVDVREREIHSASKLNDPTFTNPNELHVGQDLVMSEKTEVPITVTPEVIPGDLPVQAPTEPQN